MKRRKWLPEQKLAAVLEGLQGRAVAEICSDWGISQTQYYRWRDQFFDGAHRAFETSRNNSKEGRLEKENMRLKALVAELALEVKKTGPFG